MMIKKLITSLYKWIVRNDSPKVLGTINYNSVSTILNSLCTQPNGVHLSDSIYSVTSPELAKQFVKLSQINTDKYKSENHDCDNYSYALNGYWSDSLESFCFGIAWSYEHAFNIMIDSDKKVWIIEPQTSEFIDIETAKLNKLYYPMRLILI